MKTNLKILGLLLAVGAVLSSCEKKNFWGDFPMQQFMDYMPFHVGDTLHYQYPFVVTNVTADYGGGSTYEGEFAHYSVEAQHVGSFNHKDTAFLNVTFACERRTRIRVEYTCADNRSPSAVSSGFYNHANSSDLLFLTFPQDSLLLKETETERVVGKLEKNKGLTYFYYGNIKYELQ